MNKNYLQPNQPSFLAALSPAASPDTYHSPLTTSHSLKCKSAFTLTEVLITLGIIGVVAALTLPTLIQNYQKYVAINKVKKFYTEMNQVMQYSIADNGEYNTWDFSLRSYEFYSKYFEKYLKKVTSVQKNIGVCGEFLGGIRVVFADGTQMIFSFTSYYMLDVDGKEFNAYAPVLIFYTSAKNYENSDGLDINPMRERFYFTINDKGAIVPPNLKATRDSNLANCKRNCTCNGEATNTGHQECSTLIYKDGWKISGDYPW